MLSTLSSPGRCAEDGNVYHHAKAACCLRILILASNRVQFKPLHPTFRFPQLFPPSPSHLSRSSQPCCSQKYSALSSSSAMATGTITTKTPTPTTGPALRPLPSARYATFFCLKTILSIHFCVRSSPTPSVRTSDRPISTAVPPPTSRASALISLTTTK